ncbi:MAG: alpha-amylase family glycosyl hydrolase, partial [Ferruginibacter sp.]
MKMIRLIAFVVYITASLSAFAQNDYQCYPTHWWTGMKYNSIQVMIHGDAIANAAGGITLQAYPGVKLVKLHKVENTNYVFADLTIAATTKPGILKFKVNRENNPFEIPFQLKAKRKARGKDFAQGVTSRDFIYLILPDRFSNGDPSNDRVEGMRDQSLNRAELFDRHGGDLLGITNKLDYLEQLGVTTLWLNPVIENDRKNRTEHGYAFTNHYKIDPRFGGENAYQQLIDAVHKKGMKIIQDAVYNHVDAHHFTVLDKPMKEWLNNWPSHVNTSYKDQVLFDPYAAPSQKKILSDGWFTTEMPDLNQRNPYVAKFLIQHAIWTVEEFGIDGWRIDTYAYNDLDFMNQCNKALMDEYPQITMFGETWVHGVPNQSYFCQNTLNIPFKSNLQAVTDFQALWGIQDALTQDFGWTSGVTNLYTRLAYDFMYKDPMRNVLFLDNHDVARFYS